MHAIIFLGTDTDLTQTIDPSILLLIILKYWYSVSLLLVLRTFLNCHVIFFLDDSCLAIISPETALVNLGIESQEAEYIHYL